MRGSNEIFLSYFKGEQSGWLVFDIEQLMTVCVCGGIKDLPCLFFVALELPGGLAYILNLVFIYSSHILHKLHEGRNYVTDLFTTPGRFELK